VELPIELRRAALDLEHAGKQPLAAEATLDALFHRPPDAEQRRARRGCVAPGRLVAQHEFVQFEAMLATAREQFVARRERQRHLDRARIARRLAQRRRAHDETAPRREEFLAMQHRTAGIERREAHAVGVTGQGLVAMEQQVHRLVEADLVRACEPQPLLSTDPRQGRFDRVRVESVRRQALEPEQHGSIGAVPFAGQCQRTIELRRDRVHARQQRALLEILREAPGGVHRPHRVRTRWADPDLEDVEDGEVHALL
jgi:hypothetical protein